MQQESKSTGGAAVAVGIVMLVIGALIGFGVTKATANDTNSTSSNSSMVSASTKAADLRANLVTLGVEHMQLTDQAVDAALDGSADATALSTALNTNGTNLGAAVGSVYGADAQKTFDSVWQLHLDQFVKYAVAAKGGDTAGKQTALDTIDNQYTKPLAQYLAKANPNLPENAVETALRDHVMMTAGIIDDHVAGDYSKETSDLAAANKHIEGIMSTLADGIVKQYPNKF